MEWIERVKEWPNARKRDSKLSRESREPGLKNRAISSGCDRFCTVKAIVHFMSFAFLLADLHNDQ